MLLFPEKQLFKVHFEIEKHQHILPLQVAGELWDPYFSILL